MKKKNFISTVLAAALLFGTVAGVLPVTASAAYATSIETGAVKTNDEVQKIITTAKSYNGDKVVDFTAEYTVAEYPTKVVDLAAEEGIASLVIEETYDLGTVAGVTDAKTALSADPAITTEHATYTFTPNAGVTKITVTKTCDVSSPEAVLGYEIYKGYIDSVVGDKFALYVNRYTGMMYYKNTLTGQILTSNPYDLGYITSSGADAMRSELLSQIHITFNSVGDASSNGNYYSTDWAAMYSQISVSRIKNGLRVNYTLGDTSTRFLLPGAVPLDNFVNDILKPLVAKFEAILDAAHIYYEPFDFDAVENTRAVNENEDNRVFDPYSLLSFVESLSINKKYTEATSFRASFKDFLMNGYSIVLCGEEMDPNNDNDILNAKRYPALEDGAMIVPLNSRYEENEKGSIAAKRNLANFLNKYCPSYTFSMMTRDEKECGYVDPTAQKPAFRCALEYTLDETGDLLVRLPANSISFDETLYNLTSIVPLESFGVGDMENAGYVFLPDGSGTVIDFADFYGVNKINVSLASAIYGKDYCYANMTGAHSEQITMPVYGIVGETKVNPSMTAVCPTLTDKASGGFFAIIEDGESLAELNVSSNGSKNKYMKVYASYNPYPSDKYDLSETISVSGLGEYTIVAESKYTGSYVTRYKMLSDPAVISTVAGAENDYVASYIGMADYYRDYLKEKGVLTAVETVGENIPLYIEVLGSMQITTKILSFPVKKQIPLTSFEDIATIYDELRHCKEDAEEKAQTYAQRADAETDPEKKAELQRLSDDAAALAAQIVDITNVNFRLTGFTNGGMYATYPTKVRWEKACGGKRGFKELLKTASAASANDGENFGVYPEFDFMYISNSKLFDGVSNRSASKMVDNRYASKQAYDSVGRFFDRLFALVVSPDALDKLFSKFEKKYGKYDLTAISASTLGSDLNSNFDEDNPINRDEAEEYVTELLDRITSGGYSLMMNGGNIYTVKYATHLLDVATDSSNFAFSSYSVPFLGMILHGHVNYTGSALNYSGSPAHEMLRSIECGANPYYILCYRNTSHMKDDKELSKYYSVDYKNWFESIVTIYSEMNAVLGSLQTFELTGHELLLAERVLSATERKENLVLLEKEICEILDKTIADAIDAKYEEMRIAEKFGTGIALTVDADALLTQFAGILGLDVDELKGEYETVAGLSEEDLVAAEGFAADLFRMIKGYVSTYSTAGGEALSISSIVYETAYNFTTDSVSDDRENYVFSNYTCDNRNVVKVTYTKGAETVSYILNYNVYDVTVTLNDAGGTPITYTLPMNGYVKVQ